jgi:hypothetical protein
MTATPYISPFTDGCLEQNPVFTLTNSFRGMSFRQITRIREIQDNSAVLEVSDVRAFTNPGERLYLHNRVFTTPFKARLLDHDFAHGLLYLADIDYMDTEWQERRCERVQPKDPIYITLRYNHKMAQAFIEDISQDGIGLIIGERLQSELGLRPSCKIGLDLVLPPSYRFFTLKGTLLHLHPMHGCTVRLGIRVHPEWVEAGLLEKYITHRRAEILKELDQALIDAFEPAGVEKQYF